MSSWLKFHWARNSMVNMDSPEAQRIWGAWNQWTRGAKNIARQVRRTIHQVHINLIPLKLMGLLRHNMKVPLSDSALLHLRVRIRVIFQFITCKARWKEYWPTASPLRRFRLSILRRRRLVASGEAASELASEWTSHVPKRTSFFYSLPLSFPIGWALPLY